MKEDTIAAQILDRDVADGFSDVELLHNDPHVQRVTERPEFAAIIARLS